MRSTSCTPSRISISSFSTLCAPTTPSTVRVAPEERCTSMPISMRRAMTVSICASVARSFITTTMTLLSCFQILAAFARHPLGATRLVDHAFENADDRFGGQRPRQRGGGLPDLGQYLRFALRLINREAGLMLEATHFHRARNANVEESHELIVDHVDPAPQLLDGQDFSQRTYSSTRLFTLSEAPASAITFTRALPTTAASAHWPTARTCSGLEIPKPSATGRSLTALIRATICSAPSASWSRTPVTPSREIAYRKPLPRAGRSGTETRCRGRRRSAGVRHWWSG